MVLLIICAWPVSPWAQAGRGSVTNPAASPTGRSMEVSPQPADESPWPRAVFYPPLGLPGLHTLEEGRAVGMYPELIAMVARTARIKGEIRSVPWPEPLDAVRSGEGDVLGPVMGLPSSFSDLLHTAPLMRVEWARYVRTGESRRPAAISFQGVRVAVISDSFGTRWLSREHPTVIQVPVETIEEGIDALLSERADSLLSMKLPTRTLIKRTFEDRIEEVGTELTAPMSLGIAPASKDLMPRLNAAIEALTASGEMEQVRNRWMPPAPRTSAEISQGRLTASLLAMVVILLGLALVLWMANRRLARARAQAEEARQAKSNFLAVMSHEIRTPINGLVNLIDLLQRTPTNAEQTDLLRKAEQANRSLLTLVNQVLDYSKIEAAQMEIRPHPMKLSALMAHAQAVLQAQSRAPAVELQVLCADERLPMLMADEQRLAQVLINLGGNALKFAKQGHVRVSVQPLLPFQDERGHSRLRFEVEDTGPGIPAEDLPRLFKPFVQLQAGLDRPHTGTGLGLSTSRELVRQMGGELQVSSTPGVRTRFWFDLALPAAPGEALGDHALDQGVGGAEADVPRVGHESPPRSEPSTPIRRGLRVMVVDDNPLNLLVTRKILEQEAHEVQQAEGAAAALAALSAEGARLPDLILMDLHMPGMDGIEAMRHFRALLGGRLPPVLAVSGAVTADVQAAAHEAGMAGFLPKPFDRAGLLKAIATFQMT